VKGVFERSGPQGARARAHPAASGKRQHEKDDLILSILSANTGTNLAILCHLIPSLKYYSEDQAGVFTSRWFERCRARTMLTVLEIFRAP
jgi:hypothetical protein